MGLGELLALFMLFNTEVFGLSQLLWQVQGLLLGFSWELEPYFEVVKEQMEMIIYIFTDEYFLMPMEKPKLRSIKG